jgi:plasmid maintenance system antidote protein VapI
LRVLLILKQNEKVGISRRDVAKLAGVDPNNLSSIINNLIVNKLALFG